MKVADAKNRTISRGFPDTPEQHVEDIDEGNLAKASSDHTSNGCVAVHQFVVLSTGGQLIDGEW
jgi:hypothetical protein